MSLFRVVMCFAWILFYFLKINMDRILENDLVNVFNELQLIKISNFGLVKKLIAI